jgi:NADH:ubiquinone oxidoreductase subunit F (NADH-binding)
MSAAEAMSRIAPPSSTQRLLDGLRADARAVSLAEHADRYGGVPRASGDELVALLGEAGLRGRGGAAFPAALKLAAVREGRGRPIVVANGAEGEPPSGKDKVLLAYVPHLVLDGAVLAARAVGAKEVIVAAGPVVLPQVRHALAERRAAGADRGLTLRLVAVPDRFVAGEETALVAFLNGGPALPTFTPPRPFERGVRGAPTLVQNVETLANVALIARFGADWFRGAGTPDEPGTALVTLSGAIRSPGVYEVELGQTLQQLIDDAGGPAADLQAFLVGGFFGTWLSGRDAAAARLSNVDLARYGAALGARAIVALPTTACGVAETAKVARYLADESAGQCGPCVHGLASVADGLEQLVRRERHVDHGLVRRRLAAIAGRGACSHPDGAVKLVASAYDVFPTEFERHLQNHRCTGRGGSVLRIPSGAAR